MDDSFGEREQAARSLAVLIVGMHRSGTSALSGVLNKLGVDLPEDLHPADEHNERGYFEPRRIIDFHEALFAKLGSPSNDPIPLSYGWVDSPIGRAAAAELAEILDQEFGASAMCLFKDPRICRLAPVWTRALELSGRDAAAVLTLRHPLEVAGSLQKKAGVGRVYSLFMWLQHVVLGERFTRELRRSFVSYDQILEDWRPVVRKLSADLGLAWPRDPVRAAADIDAFLSSELRHHKRSDHVLNFDDPLETLCGRAWEAARRFVGDPADAVAMAEFDRIWADFEGGLELFAPLVTYYQREVGRALEYGEAKAHELELQLGHQTDMAEQRGRQIAELDGRIAELDGRTALRETRLAALESQLRERDWRTMELDRSLRHAAELHRGAVARAEASETRLQAIEQSHFWRFTSPVRLMFARHPRLRRMVRGGLKIGWWTVTLRLFSKLSARRRMIEALAAAPAPSPAPAAPPLPEPPPGPPVAIRPLRIAFASGEASTPGHKYRIERWAEAARQIGATVSVFPVHEAGGQLGFVGTADLLYIWRAPWDGDVHALVSTAKAGGAAVMFDVDDLMFEPELARTEIIDGIRSQGLTEDSVAEYYKRVQNTLIASDYCSAPTPFLAERLRRFWRPTFLLPNGFDDEVFKRSRLAIRRWSAERDASVRIGYATGSKTHQRDFAQCVGAVARILREFPHTVLVLFRADDRPVVDIAEFPQLAGLEGRIEWRELVPIVDLPDELARFDISLAPLEVGNMFCESKSELKFFEAALVDVPTVASTTEPFRRAIVEGETGFLAEAEDEWYAALKTLVQEPERRREMARRALYDSLADFGPERRAELFRSAVEQIVFGGQRGARAFELDVRRDADRIRPHPHVASHEVVLDIDRLRPSEATVVVPLYNYADYVLEALESAKAQTLADLDLIVVDDASTDDSLAVARRWIEANAARFNRAILIRNTPNAGLGFARNVGFERAETPFVIPLDADNRLRPEFAEKTVAEARRTGAAFVYPGIRQFGDGSRLMGELRYVPARLIGGNYIDAMALVRKSSWAAVGGYDHVRYGWEDYDLWCRFAERGYFGHRVPEVLADYRVHGKSMLRSETNLLRNNSLLIQDMERRHGWLRIDKPERFEDFVIPERPRRKPAPPSSAWRPTVSGSEGTAVAAERLSAILPLLRCPVTGAALEQEGEVLRAVGTGRSWPLLDGRPVLFDGLDQPRVMDVDHVSNPLPPEVASLIERTKGPVLHLSAGASERRWPHVIEAEFALFAHTDVLADAHALPFADGAFELVVSMNAFEHYHSPTRVAAEILRVLRPGGRLFVHTAFMQPLHEAPWHFYNCTRYGLEKWFEAFETLDLRVSENFNPIYALAWQLSEAEGALRSGLSGEEADSFLETPARDLVDLWRDPGTRKHPVWTSFHNLPQAAQEPLAAGFQFVGRKPK